MTLYYAPGGGLGHLSRARRALRALEIENAEVISGADLPRELEGRAQAHADWLAERCRGRRLIVDAFPFGIQGELALLRGLQCEYVARLLRWKAYLDVCAFDAPPRFQTAYVVETLTDDHAAFVARASLRVRELDLGSSFEPRSSRASPDPYALVVHSGPESEVQELLAYARELGPERIVVMTRCEMILPAGCERIETDRPFDFMQEAERIVSAAGFNVMLETETWRSKHHVLPFPRRFDDQFLRAARRRHASAGVGATCLPAQA